MRAARLSLRDSFILVCWNTGLLWLSVFLAFRLVLHLRMPDVCYLLFAVCCLLSAWMWDQPGA
jgi:hypothetical protein